MLKKNEAKNIVSYDMVSRMDELKEYLKKSKNVNYQDLFESAMPNSYTAFSLLLENIPDIWQPIEIVHALETKTIPFAIKIAQHVRHISPNNFWELFVKKIEQDILLQPVHKHKDLLAQLLIETDSYPVTHHALYEPINRILGKEAAYDLYFENMKDISGGGMWFIKVALNNSSKEKQINVLKNKIEKNDFESAEIITKNLDFSYEDVKDILINNEPLIQFVKSRVSNYREEILKNSVIKDIDSAFEYEIHNEGIGKQLHTNIMNYYDLKRVVDKLSKLEPIDTKENNVSKKMKM